MFLWGFRRKWMALSLCKSTESAIQCFQITLELTLQPYTIQLYLSGARVSIFPTLVPQLNTLLQSVTLSRTRKLFYHVGILIPAAFISVFFLLLIVCYMYIPEREISSCDLVYNYILNFLTSYLNFVINCHILF